jgi:hypothetical protein
MGIGVQGYCSNIMLTVLNQMYNCLDQLFCKSFTYLFTYSMEESPSWEANRFSASLEIPRILWNPKVH